MRSRIIVIGLFSIVFAIGLLAIRYEDFRKLDFRRLPGRAGWQLPSRTVEALGIEPGDRVVDLGAGDGYFIGFLAAAVGSSGRVYAVEIFSSALENLEERVRKEALANVEVIAGVAADPNLPDGAVDLVFLCDVYHHIGDRGEYFSRLKTDLAPGGRVAVVEPRPHGFGGLVSPAGHAMPADEVIAEMEEAGYRLDERLEFLPVQSLLVFRAAD